MVLLNVIYKCILKFILYKLPQHARKSLRGGGLCLNPNFSRIFFVVVFVWEFLMHGEGSYPNPNLLRKHFCLSLDFVTCHVSGVTFNMSHVPCHVSLLLFFLFFVKKKKVLDLLCYQEGLLRAVSTEKSYCCLLLLQ